MEKLYHNPAATQQKLVAAYFRTTAPHWEEIYTEQGVYAAVYQLRRAVVLSLVDALRLPMGSRSLDIGCGPGLTTVALAERGYAVHAIDPVKAMVQRTRQQATDAHLGERVFASGGDIHNLSFANDVFDLVLVVGVTEWLEDLRRPLQEISRVLKPGGHVIVTADNKWALHNVMDPRLNPALAPMRRCVRRALEWSGRPKERSAQERPAQFSYSIRHLDRLLSTFGLQKVAGVTLGFGPFSFLRYRVLPESIGLTLHRRLQHLADKRVPVLRSAGFVYVAAARKGSDTAR